MRRDWSLVLVGTINLGSPQNFCCQIIFLNWKAQTCSTYTIKIIVIRKLVNYMRLTIFFISFVDQLQIHMNEQWILYHC